MEENTILCRLSELSPGDRGHIESFDTDNDLLIRLGDFGVREGTAVICERVGFLGDPAAYRFCGASDQLQGNAIQGTVIAIRTKDAERIQIKKTASDGGSWD